MLLKRQHVYSGKIVDLVVDTILVQGRPAIREVVRHPGGVVVLAELQDGRIPFVRQHRYPMDQVLLELPAGKIDEREAPAVSAARELEEETGFRPLQLEPVFRFYPTPGFCDELLHLFYCNRLERTRQNLEFDEELSLEFYPLEQALQLALKGEIRDGKSLLALFWLFWKRRQEADAG